MQKYKSDDAWNWEYFWKAQFSVLLMSNEWIYFCEEGHKRPFHLCPICLRKLLHNIGFDPFERFKTISKPCKVNPHFNKEKEYIIKR